MKGRGECQIVVLNITTRKKKKTTLKQTINVQINQKENIHKATQPLNIG